MADEANVAPALAALDRLKQSLAGIDAPVLRLKSAFDEVGRGWRSAVRGLVTGRLSPAGAALRVGQSAEMGLIDMAGGALARTVAGPLGTLFGGSLSGLAGDFGRTEATAANTAALAANTAALAALGASLGAAAAAGGVGALGGAAALAGGTALGAGSGVFDFLGGLFAFEGGGIVPSAARGWALPDFVGARPALLHAREMVLPAPISEGLQQMIGEGGGGGDMHLHFHGPSDGPAVERWFTGLMARNPGVIRNMLRSNALTPRTL
ncbi:MAG TPA: hypothetical protein VFX06_11585 [Stellaceae bacterium]|nr:hypothetical protein [Stellaceae bacterium]